MTSPAIPSGTSRRELRVGICQRDVEQLQQPPLRSCREFLLFGHVRSQPCPRDTSGHAAIEFPGPEHCFDDLYDRLAVSYGAHRQADVPDRRNATRSELHGPLVELNESGWGMAMAHQFGNIFLAWYVYDGSGSPVWYVASNCMVSGSSCSRSPIEPPGPGSGHRGPSQVHATACVQPLSASSTPTMLFFHTPDQRSRCKQEDREAALLRGAVPAGLPRGIGGVEGDRTLDLRIANATLSQLSYHPMERGNYNLQAIRPAADRPLFGRLLACRCGASPRRR